MNNKSRGTHPFESFNFCPKCGSDEFEIEDSKSKICRHCGFHYYFNPSASVVAFIINEKNELLVCRRAKDPAKGTLDITGGFADCNETAEEAVVREVKEETELEVTELKYLFSLPNIYPFSGFDVHTVDIFFLCKVKTAEKAVAHDDVMECFYVPLNKINPKEFGLASISKGVKMFLELFAEPVNAG